MFRRVFVLDHWHVRGGDGHLLVIVLALVAHRGTGRDLKDAGLANVADAFVAVVNVS